MSPNDPVVLNNLAYCLAAQRGLGRIDEALPLAQKALEAAPNAPAVADTLGWIHVLRKDAAAAVPTLEHASAAAADNAEIRVHLAGAYALAGRTTDATRELDRALKENPALGDQRRRADGPQAAQVNHPAGSGVPQGSW